MKTKDDIKIRIPSNAENPFKVPVRYFESLHDRVMDGIANADVSREIPVSRSIFLRPYFAVAASITGLALISYIVLQSVLGPSTPANSYFDLSMMENSGILYDQSVIYESYYSSQPKEYSEWEEEAINHLANSVIYETYYSSQQEDYSEWEEEAITYLASNEVDLLHLLGSY